MLLVTTTVVLGTSNSFSRVLAINWDKGRDANLCKKGNVQASELFKYNKPLNIKCKSVSLGSESCQVKNTKLNSDLKDEFVSWVGFSFLSFEPK